MEDGGTGPARAGQQAPSQPHRQGYADAHLKRQIMGREVVVPITIGILGFGPWERILHGEFDERRRKRELIKTTGE